MISHKPISENNQQEILYEIVFQGWVGQKTHRELCDTLNRSLTLRPSLDSFEPAPRKMDYSYGTHFRDKNLWAELDHAVRA